MSPWEKCDVEWGNTSKNLPWNCVSGGSQTTHAMTRAAHAVAMDGKTRAAGDCCQNLRRQAGAVRSGERTGVPQGRGKSMTLAQAAQRAIQLGGIYDGHEAPEDVNKYTKDGDGEVLHVVVRWN